MPPSPRPRSLEARIHDHYAGLPESERRLAEVILDLPGEIAAYSATELAKLAGVSKAAASRLFKRLGFASFEEARRLARDARQWGSPLYLSDRQNTLPAGEAGIAAVLEDHQAALARAFEALTPAVLDEALERLVAAQRLWLVGFRNSYFVAAYARWQFIQFRPNVRLLPHAGETLGEYLSEFTADDLLLVFGFRRRVAALGRVVEAAYERETPILYMTDPSDQTAQRLATWRIVFDIATAKPFDSYVGAIGLVHCLSVLAMRKAGRSGRARLEAIERAHESLGEFD